MDKKMKQTVQTLLADGETVLWQGKTEPFGIIAGHEGRAVLRQWVIASVCIFGFLPIVYRYGSFTPTVVGLLLTLWAILMAAPYLNYRRSLSRCYVITDRRSMVVNADGTAHAIPHRELDGWRAMDLDHGGKALVLGSEILGEGDRQLRWRALHPKLGHYAKSNNGLTEAVGLVFYNIGDIEGAERVLKAHGAGYAPEARSAA